MKIEKQLEDNIGLNNKRVWPKTAEKPAQMPMFQEMPEPTPTQQLQELSKSVKAQMNEDKFNVLTRDPENNTGHQILREKYQLPQPNRIKYGRAQGGICNVELEKLGIGGVRPNKVF